MWLRQRRRCNSRRRVAAVAPSIVAAPCVTGPPCTVAEQSIGVAALLSARPFIADTGPPVATRLTRLARPHMALLIIAAALSIAEAPSTVAEPLSRTGAQRFIAAAHVCRITVAAARGEAVAGDSASLNAT